METKTFSYYEQHSKHGGARALKIICHKIKNKKLGIAKPKVGQNMLSQIQLQI